jgi:hypothetical protein
MFLVPIEDIEVTHCPAGLCELREITRDLLDLSHLCTPIRFFLLAGTGVVSINLLSERNNLFPQRHAGIDFTDFDVKIPFFLVTAVQGIEECNIADAAIGNQLLQIPS